MDGLNNFVQSGLDVVDNNKIVNSLVGLFLVLYAGLAAPKLPRHVAQLFDYTAFKIVVLFLIAYIASKDKSVAIIAVVALVVSFQTLTKFKVGDMVANVVARVTPAQSNNDVAEEVVQEPVMEMPVGDNDVASEVEVEDNAETQEEVVIGYSGNEFAQI